MKKLQPLTIILIIAIYFSNLSLASPTFEVKLESMDARPGIYTLYEDEIKRIEINVTYNSLHNYTPEPAVNVTVKLNSEILWSVFSLKNRRIMIGKLLEWQYYPLWIPKGLESGDEIEVYNSKFTIIKAGDEIIATNGSLTLKYDSFSGVMTSGDFLIKGEKFRVTMKSTNMKLRKRQFKDMYMDWETLTQHLMQLNGTYHDVLKVYALAESCLGRQIWVCEINARKNEEAVIVIDGGMHGSEAISVKAAVYVLDNILEHYETIEELDRISLVIIPMLNPDGVEASKFLPPKPRIMLKYARCNARGVDLNRNFMYAWEAGGSDNYESPTFRGLSPETEPEVKMLLNLFKARNVIFYINLHSGVSATLIPGYTANPYVQLYEYEIATGIANIFNHEVYMGKIYGGAANWIIFAYEKTALSIIIELYGDKEQLDVDWFYFYNPHDIQTVQDICDKTYYSVLYILKNAEKWVKEAEEIKAEQKMQLEITIISIVLVIGFAVIIIYKQFRKLEKQSIKGQHLHPNHPGIQAP